MCVVHPRAFETWHKGSQLGPCPGYSGASFCITSILILTVYESPIIMEPFDAYDCFNDLIDWDYLQSDVYPIEDANSASILSHPLDTTSHLSVFKFDVSLFPLRAFSNGDFEPEDPLSSATVYSHEQGRSSTSLATTSSSDVATPPRQRSGRVQKSKKIQVKPMVSERRYRAGLLERITELGQCLPTVRVCHQENWRDKEELPQGLVPARNHRKPTILAKAVEYIQYLEARNHHLCFEI